MTLKDAEVIRNLIARVESLERSNADLTRRMDDISKAERARDTLKLKKDAA